MSRKALRREEREELAKLAAMPDEAIDTSDIPEAPAENWIDARRGGLYRPVKRPVTLRLDAPTCDRTSCSPPSASGSRSRRHKRNLRRADRRARPPPPGRRDARAPSSGRRPALHRRDLPDRHRLRVRRHRLGHQRQRPPLPPRRRHSDRRRRRRCRHRPERSPRDGGARVRGAAIRRLRRSGRPRRRPLAGLPGLARRPPLPGPRICPAARAEHRSDGQAVTREAGRSPHPPSTGI